MYTDPVTGDPLSAIEYWTRKAQGWLRSPWFLVLFHLSLVLAFILHKLDLWNVFASALAVDVEWVVGTFNFGVQGRDGVYIRRIARLEEVNQKQLEHLEYLVAKTLGPELPQGRQNCVHREAPEAAER